MKKDRSEPLMETENSVMDSETLNTTEFPTITTVEAEKEVEDKPRKAAHHKKRRGLFGRRKKNIPQDDESATLIQSVEKDPILLDSEDEEDIKVYGNDEMDVTREVTVSQKTRVLDDKDDEDDGDEQATQMMLEGFDNEEDSEEQEGDTLRRIRQEKIQDFSQRREEHERAEAEQEEPESDEPVLEEAAAPIEEPKTEQVTRPNVGAIRQKLQAARRSTGTALFVSAVMELILFIMALVSFYSPAVTMQPTTYLVLHLIFFIVMIVSAWPRLRVGLSRLFGKSVTIESGVALSAIFTLVHTGLQFLNTTGIAEGTTPLFTSVTGLALVLMQLADKLETERVYRTFSLAAGDGELFAAKCIEDADLAEEIGRPAVAMGEPHVTYFRKTAFVTDYLKNAEDTMCGNALVRWYLPTVLGVSLVAAVVFLLLNGLTTWLLAVTLFCAMVCIASPVLMLVFLRVSMALSASDMKKSGAAIIGAQAVEKYGATHAVVLDSIDLFPESSVLLHGIKTFSGTRIDEAILDAASVSVRAGGPLSHVFRRMILNKVDMLHEVDTLVYEQDMGLSGWVSGRRVLIGNRKLLDNHGIDIPSKDYEERYAKNGRQLVYLSIAGELSAMFVISYIADSAVKKMLCTLTSRRTTLLVRTCDPNITESLLASTFGLNGFYVELLGAPAGRSYESLVDGVSDYENAEIVSTGNTAHMLGALAKCRRLTTGSRVFTVLQSVIGFLGIALAAYMAFFGNVLIAPLFAIEFLLVATVVAAVAAVMVAKT